ncbi:MAG: glycosyltransferase family 2 protein [Thermoleophilaceae bacterium]
MAIRISVFIPVWNDAAWLPGAIESVLAQSHGSWELIVGDNGSTDDLRAVVEGYPDPRINYRRWPTHVGIFENFNRTMELCGSEWLQALCADDRLHPACLERIASCVEERSLQAGRLAMVLTGCRRVGADGRPAPRESYYGFQRIKTVKPGLYSAREWLRVAAAPGAWPWNIGSVAIPREVLSESGGYFRPEVGLACDAELMMRVAAYGDVAFIDEPLLDYTVRSDSDRPARFDSNLSRGYRLTPIGAAYLSALQAHEERREVTAAERAMVLSAVARSHIGRAGGHRYLSGGRGRRGALADLARAFAYSPRTLLAPRALAFGLATLLAPRSLLIWGLALWSRRSVRA